MKQARHAVRVDTWLCEPEFPNEKLDHLLLTVISLPFLTSSPAHATSYFIPHVARCVTVSRRVSIIASLH